MEKYKCFIVDDEPLALVVIEQHLSRFADFEVCGKSSEPIEAIGLIKRLQPDLLFLDIQMPELNGLELLESIQHKPAVILTTAYREYAVEGFELNVLDYLVKPIPFKRFVKAIDRFLELRLAGAAPAAAPPDPSCIFVKADRKTVKVALDDILYVEGVKDYVKIVLPNQKILTKASIGQFFQQLPPERFLQVHKSFLVARDKISAYTAHDVEIGELEIPIGRMYKADFLKAVEGA